MIDSPSSAFLTESCARSDDGIPWEKARLSCRSLDHYSDHAAIRSSALWAIAGFMAFVM
jgi:hypothetical protein